MSSLEAHACFSAVPPAPDFVEVPFRTISERLRYEGLRLEVATLQGGVFDLEFHLDALADSKAKDKR
jgi:hypothetical protein